MKRWPDLQIKTLSLSAIALKRRRENFIKTLELFYQNLIFTLSKLHPPSAILLIYELYTLQKPPGPYPRQIKARTKNDNASLGIPIQPVCPVLYQRILQKPQIKQEIQSKIPQPRPRLHHFKNQVVVMALTSQPCYE